MKGLLIKDLLVLKKTGRVFLAMLGLYIIMAVFMHTDFGGLMVLLCGMLSITTFAYDEQAKWDAYALTMPLSKRDLVRSKYVLSLILGIIGVFSGAILSISAGLSNGFLDWHGILISSGLTLCASYIFNSIALPFLYKLGAEKSRMVLMVCYALPILAVSLVMNELENSPAILIRLQSWLDMGAKLLPFVTLAFLGLSYNVSLHIYQKKDI